MKIIDIKYLITLVLILGINACAEEALDKKNLGVYNPAEVWNDETLANAYLVDVYASSLSGWPLNNGNNADETIGILGEGAVQTTNSAFKMWPYSQIRKINVLFGEIDEGSLVDDVKNPIKGQAHFLRAWHYYSALAVHGGVPIIDYAQLLTDDLMVPRNSSKECFDFIINDLDAAIGLLPNQYAGGDYGRVDKAAAMAFKGRVMLHMASPQFNPSNPYGNSYWQDAYTVNKAAKDQLESWGYGLLDNYGEIFNTEGHKEAVLVTVYSAPGKTNGRGEHCVRPLSQSKNCTGGDQPIWDFVESYPMADGLAPGTSPTYTYDLQTFWENRDPRFYANLVYNGDIFELSGHKDRRQFTDLQVGGLDDGFGPGQTFGRTGFYARKGINVDLPIAEVEQNDYDWIEIRFAEVLFNFAEAANETGHEDEALEVLKQIRARAGIEEGAGGRYGLKAGMTTIEQRDAIYFEKYLEFAFEGKRFNDLRRTRRLHTDINGMKKYGLLAVIKAGLDPVNPPDGGFLPTDFDYTVTETINTGQTEMYTPEEYYFFPIHKNEIEKNPTLLQNVGWESGTFDPTL